VSSEPVLIADGHLDLAFNALHLRRDLTRDALAVRESDGPETLRDYGTCTVTLPELRRGRVGLVLGTIMVRIDAAGSYAGSGMRVQSQCHGVARGHAAYYEILEQTGELRIIRTASDLARHVSLWTDTADPSRLPVGVVLAMESSDPILGPEQVEYWHGLGLRCASLCHYGVGAYAHGTGTEGGLLPRAREMLRTFAEHGVMLDVTHLTDQGLWEALELYDGPVLASHHNCRALVPGQRQLDDAMLGALIERDGVIGTSFDLWMLDPEFVRGRQNPRRKNLEAVVDHIDHVCQLAGGSRHAAVGSDLDGGFGAEQSPAGVDTIADVAALADRLSRRGYVQQDVQNVLCGNWLRLLRKVLR
jgi:membrane dipeptidase